MRSDFPQNATHNDKPPVTYRWWPAALCVAGSATFMLVAMARYWPATEFAFMSDNSPVSWLSSAQLWAIAILAMRMGVDRALSPIMSVWLSAAMMVLAFDEQFMFHEHWKHGCHEWWDACRHHWVTEIPIILVGLIGFATILRLHFVSRSRIARALLWSSMAVGVLAIAVDIFAWPVILVRLEEPLEVLAEALFAGFLLGLPAGSHAPQG